MFLPAFAEETSGNGASGNAGAATWTVVGGPKSKHTGWLFYLVDGSGRQVTQTEVVYSSKERPGKKCLGYGKTRFGGNTGGYRETYEGFDALGIPAPFDTEGNGNGSKIKAEMLKKKIPLTLVAQCFPDKIEEFVNARSQPGQELYLVLEPFFWGQMYNGMNAGGVYLCATAKGWAQTQLSLGYAHPELGAPPVKRYTNNVFPNCVRLQSPQLGYTPLSGSLNNSQIASAGNGFMLFWATEQTTTLPEDTLEGVEGKQLYAIRNRSEEFEIDRAIPSGESVQTNFEADCFYGNAQVSMGSASKTYRVKYTYRWKERRKSGGYRDENGVWHTRYKTVDKEKTNTVQFTAYAYYQYVKQVQLYGLNEILVRNKAYAQDRLFTKENAERWPEVRADITLYEGDTKYDFAEKVGVNSSSEKHYSFPEVSGKNVISVSNENEANSRMTEDERALRNYVFNHSWTRNDNLVVEALQNGQPVRYPFMEDTKVNGCTIYGGLDKRASDSSYRYGGNGITLESVKPLRALGSIEDEIPIVTDNGNYPSGVQATYGVLANSLNTFTTVFRAGRGLFTSGMVDDIYNHVMEENLSGTGWDGRDKPLGDGYDIKVHTPIISPVMITDNYAAPQIRPDAALLDVDERADFQLKLDKFYMLKWNLDQWVSSKNGGRVPKGYEENMQFHSVYDKYVEKKIVKFPFPVYYNGRFFEADKWITVQEPSRVDQLWSDGLSTAQRNDYESNNHWQMMPFYIPGYAVEESGTIETRVYAKNVEGRYEGSHNVISAMELQKNSGQDSYIAQYKTREQLSGFLYGFTITGVDGAERYGDGLQYGEYAFAPEKKEVVAGIKNRSGNSVLRNVTDGSLWEFVRKEEGYYDPDDRLLPLRRESNLNAAFPVGDGRLWLGTGFDFTLKTMGSLTGDLDEIRITPTFRFYDREGQMIDALSYRDGVLHSRNNRLKIYTRKNGEICPFLGDEKEEHYSISMGSPFFREAFYGEEDTLTDENNGHVPLRFGSWMEYTANRWGENHGGAIGTNVYDYLRKAYPCYSNDSIILSAKLRIFSGEWDMLARNERRDGNALITYQDINQDGVPEEGVDAGVIKRFRDSGQLWFGGYCMPAELYILDTFDETEKPFSRADFLDDIDVVLNFDIVSFHNGIAHLTYNGTPIEKSMWAVEGYQTGEYWQYGDVAVYTTGHKEADRYKYALLDIN